MYFPTSAARQLSTVPAIPNLSSDPVISIQASPRKTLFCTLTRDSLTVWRVRPSAVLGHLVRTSTSLKDHGENVAVYWSPDGGKIVIQTTLSYLVLVTVEYSPNVEVYQRPALGQSVQVNFLPGAGEGVPLQSLSLSFEGLIRVEGHILSVSPRKNCILFSTKTPPAIQRIPWPVVDELEGDESPNHSAPVGYSTWLCTEDDFPWLVDSDITVSKIIDSSMGLETWITSDGRAYFVRLTEDHPSKSGESLASPHDVSDSRVNSNESMEVDVDDQPPPASAALGEQLQRRWEGICIHNFEIPRWVQKQRQVDPDGPLAKTAYVDPRRAVVISINTKFSLLAIGTQGGSVMYTNFPAQENVPPKTQELQIPNPYNRQTGPVTALAWSSDGYVLAAGWTSGWAIFSVGGRCLASGFGVDDAIDHEKFQDAFMHGVNDMFWSPGNFELFILSRPSPTNIDGQIFVIPFAKSATTGQHSPDNTRYAFLQMDDRALIYRGADQPDMSVINPESDVWQHIKIPQAYLATNWPIRYSALSNDGRLIAIAGRRGLIHYSSTSGRWKLFADVVQEEAISVRGGMVWFHHVLVVAVEIAKSYQIRLYSRDLELSSQNILHREIISSPVIILSLVDNSLLVYTADNMLSHYLIVPTPDSITLHFCGSITFSGIIAVPSAVRVLSWMIPNAQKQLGDPAEDLAVATVLMVVGGQLVLLRPRKTGTEEVKYDMQIFADRVEFCWIHLRGIGALENSLWGYDGRGIRIWLNALSIESSSGTTQALKSVKESVNIPLDFYPLSVLMDKGIIIGAEHEIAARNNLPFVMFRHATSSHLFLHHILRHRLESRQVQDAVLLATHYQHLVYFAHVLEILLHTVVESEALDDSEVNGSEDSSLQAGILPAVIQFLDHFDAALDVVVGCARKTEVTRWKKLFNIVGNPKTLFEICIESKRLRTAGSYLLVLHNLEQLDDKNSDAIRLLQSAIEAQDWQLCSDLLRFLHSVDDTGQALRHALSETGLAYNENISLEVQSTV